MLMKVDGNAPFRRREPCQPSGRNKVVDAGRLDEIRAGFMNKPAGHAAVLPQLAPAGATHVSLDVEHVALTTPSKLN
jgi:hypothetical protein